MLKKNQKRASRSCQKECVQNNHVQFVYWPSEASLSLCKLGSFDGVSLLWASGQIFMYGDVWIRPCLAEYWLIFFRVHSISF